MKQNVMTRGKYWLGVVIYSICFFLVSIIVGFILAATGSPDSTSSSIAYFILFLVAGYTFKRFLAEPRVRDYGGNLKLTWLVFLPLVNYIYPICIGCYRSKKIEEK